MTGTFEGVGSLQFSPDNKRAYAFSGLVGVTNAKATVLEFDTNSEYLAGKYYFINASGSGDDFRYEIEFNDIVIVGAYRDSGNAEPQFRGKIIVPPFTNVKFTADNISSATERNHTIIFVSKVSGAIEQENLEAITNNNKWATNI